MHKTILSMQNITKIYPGVKALDHMSVAFRQGEVHALLGENGAGKSTLIKVLAGACDMDGGEVWIEEKKVVNLSPKKSMELGIQVIYQETNLIETLSAAENVYLGNWITRNNIIDFDSMYEETDKLFRDLNIQINPKTKIKYLTTGQRQIVEIAKAVSRQVKILVMDEPTSSLTNAETEGLFDIVNRLRKRGVTIIYISHRLEEIFQICDRVTIMRDGQFVKTLNVSATTRDELIKLMVGRNVSDTYPKRSKPCGETALEVRNLCGNGDINISFSVSKGEILGFSGLVGAGRTELMRLIFGADPVESGEIYLFGKKMEFDSPADAIRNGIGLIPEDRKEHGIILNMALKDNISLANLKNLSHYSIVSKKKENEVSEYYRKALNIKTPSMNQKAKNLSGGNQQKLVLAKWLATNSKVLIFDEPTRGIDVGAKQEIYKLMNQLSEQGMAIIMVSSDMEEILGMSDRIAVMYEGKLTGILDRNSFSQEKVMALASGQK